MSTPPLSVFPHQQRIAVVVNGNAKSVTDEVISSLDQILLGGDLFVSRHLQDAADIAKTVVERGYETVLTGGGDGTFTVMVTEVIREAKRRARRPPRFGLLKLGTGNALAWVVGAGDARGRGLAADIRRLSQEAGSRAMRLIEVEDFIAPFCGFGADALILSHYSDVKRRLAKTPARRLGTGLSGYALAAVTRSVPTFLFQKMPHLRVVNTGSDAFRVGAHGSLGRPVAFEQVLYEGPANLCGISTIPYYGFGFRMFPFADERQDRMHLRISTLSPVEFMSNFRGIWRGDYQNTKCVFDYLVDSVRLEIDPAWPFQIGGDVQGDRAVVQARLAEEPIRLVDFYAPPSASR